MNSIVKWISMNLDKACHFMACIIIVIISTSLFIHSNQYLYPVIAAVYGFLVSVVIGIIKEFFDAVNGGAFDLQDLLADILGGVVGFIIAVLMF